MATSQQRSPVLQFVMLACVVFLGYQILNPQKRSDPRTSTEIFAKLQELDRTGMDQAISAELNAYLAKVDEEKGLKKWTQIDVEKRKIAGHVVAAHCKFRTGLYFGARPGQTQYAYPKIERAYMELLPHFEAMRKTQAWKEPVAVYPDANLPQTEFTADGLYHALVADLADRNRGELVWGLPGYPIIDALVKVTGSNPAFSYWFAPFLLALAVRVVVYPLAQKQFMWGKQMQQLQPYVKELQQKFTDKKTGKVPPERMQALQAEQMALYKEYGVNPLAGCGPALIQMPLFLFLYQCMLHYRFEFTKGTFLWINPEVGQRFGWFQLAPNLGYTDHALIILYGISMVASQMMMPVSDMSNAKQQRIMGLTLSVIWTVFMFFYPVPSAFVLYWTFANVLATAHALWVYRHPVPPLQKVSTVKGGVIPTTATNGHTALPVDPDFFGKTGSPGKGKKGKRK